MKIAEKTYEPDKWHFVLLVRLSHFLAAPRAACQAAERSLAKMIIKYAFANGASG
jgi:hypothetical protein